MGSQRALCTAGCCALVSTRQSRGAISRRRSRCPNRSSTSAFGLVTVTLRRLACTIVVGCWLLSGVSMRAWTHSTRRWSWLSPGTSRLTPRRRGAGAEAESEARVACDELIEFQPSYAGEGFYQIGEIRRRMGDLTGAEEAFGQAHPLGRDPMPGLALVRHAQGRSA